MQWLAEICVRRPVFAVMLTAALVVAGLVSYPQLGIARFPRLDLPTVTVLVTYPGAAPEEVESEVTQILEDAVATVAGIEELRSLSQEGRSILLITFGLTRRLDAAVQDVRDAIAGVSRQLPPAADPPVVRQQDLDSSPVLTLALSGPFSSRELYVFADRAVKEVVESAAGVGAVSILGASPRAVRIDLDARRLAAYRISVLEVREALVRQNVEIPGGRVDAGPREYTLRTIGRVPEARGFADLAVVRSSGGTVRLGDLGTIVDDTKEVRRLARLDGEPAVVLQVQRQTDANTVETIRAVKERLARCRELLPPEAKLEVLQDQSRYIEAALHEIQGHLVSGSLLATVVVLLFMRSWRSTLIAAVVIPASIVSSFAFMRAFGFTLNNVTMLALVLMVGVVIDDAIVVLENVYRCIEERGMPPAEAAIEGTREIGLAVLATTLSLVIVFLPVSFLSSVTGRMLYEFGITATVAILVSMFVSFTLTPMMCSRILRPAAAGTAAAAGSRRGPYALLEAGYLALLRWSLRHRWVVVAVSLAVLAANAWLAGIVRRDYIPTNVDESEFEVSLATGAGTSLTAMDELSRQAEDRVRAITGVEFVLATVGAATGDVNSSLLYVRLTDIEERSFTWRRLLAALRAGDPVAAWRGTFSQRRKMTEVRTALAGIPGLRVAVRNLTSLRQGPPVDIDLSLTGPTVETLLPFAERLRERMESIPGVVDVDITLRTDKPEMLARLDRERMADLGITVQEVADTLRIAVGGDDRVSRYRDPADGEVYDVELRLVGIDRGDVGAISQLSVRGWPSTADGGGRGGAGTGGATTAESPRSPAGAVLTRIDNVVDFEVIEEAGRIDRLDRQRMVALRANVAPGFALGDRLAAVQEAATTLGLPPGVTARVMGRGRELERTLGEFRWTFVLSIVFMYIVLAAQYEHFVHPVTILLSLPLAVPFGLASLWAAGETLNLYSALGILVLFGVVKKAAILQVDHTKDLQAAGLPQRQAILEANRDRLRPILMTTISFVAGMLPLLVATGPGAEERRSIAVVASGGQLFSLLLTLLAVPVIYSLLDDLGRLLRRPTPLTVGPEAAYRNPHGGVPTALS